MVHARIPIRAMISSTSTISSRVAPAIDPDLLTRVDLVVTLGREAVVEVPAGVELRNWDTDEPSVRGIEGIERMRL